MNLTRLNNDLHDRAEREAIAQGHTSWAVYDSIDHMRETINHVFGLADTQEMPALTAAVLETVGVGQKIKTLRGEMSRQYVADMLGMDQSDLAKYESGAKKLPRKHLAKLCDVTNASAQDRTWLTSQFPAKAA